MTSSLEKDVLAARSMGLTYGQYKALTYEPSKDHPVAQRKESPKRGKSYSEQQVFSLWQAGKTDAEIASAVGVSRTIIQRWRDALELPSTAKNHVDTKKYRLDHLQDGTLIAIKDDEP